MNRTAAIFGAGVLVAGLAAFAVFRGDPSAGGPLGGMQAQYSGVTFTVSDSDVATLAGMDRFRMTLEPVRGRGNIQPDKMLMALCGSILSARSALQERGYERSRVFRVELQVRNEDENLFEGAIPLSVTDGACSPDIRKGLYLLRYPAPIHDYVLDFVEPVAGEEGHYELRFNHLSDAPAVLSEFDFQKACTFVAEDRPAILTPHLAFDDMRQVTIVAQSGWDAGVLSTYRNLSATFHWANGACTPVETGEPT